MPYLTVCNRQLSWTLPLVLGYLFYLLLGALVFQLLEKQAEAKTRDQFQMEKLKFLQNYTCLDRQALEQFVQVRRAIPRNPTLWSSLHHVTLMVGWVAGVQEILA